MLREQIGKWREESDAAREKVRTPRFPTAREALNGVLLLAAARAHFE
jgi:hypothetical protein